MVYNSILKKIIIQIYKHFSVNFISNIKLKDFM